MKYKNIINAIMLLILILTCSKSKKEEEKFVTDTDITFKGFDPDKTIIDSSGVEILSNRLIIKGKDEVTKDSIDSIAKSINGEIVGIVPELNLYEIEFQESSADDIENKIIELKGNEEIEDVFKDTIFYTDATNDFENNPGLWGYNIIQLGQGLTYYTSLVQEVTVAVIDTGVDIKNIDLDNNISQLSKYNFATGDTDMVDVTGHGTRVAGIIGAENNLQSGTNGIDNFNGIAYRAKILPLTVFRLDKNQKPKVSHFAIVQAVNHAKKVGAKIINISGGAYFDWTNAVFYGALKLATLDAYNNNVTIIAAAGNDNKDAKEFFPSSFPFVISVGAVDAPDGSKRASYSNFSQNDDQSVLSLVAPGSGIISTVPIVGLDTNCTPTVSSCSGTSFAAPFVSGLAAMILSLKPSLTPAQVEQTMRDTAENITVSYPDNSQHTWKRINAYNAVRCVVEGVCQQSTTCTSLPCEVWNKTYDSGYGDGSYGIAVDGSGNVYITGYSYNGTNDDYRTIKYDTNGNIIWNKTYNSGYGDGSYGIAVDASGNVYVTSYSYNGTNSDFRTIKYRQ